MPSRRGCISLPRNRGHDLRTQRGSAVEPPKPFGATPTPVQVKHAERAFYAFCHFTVDTFTDREWGTGGESESVFNPKQFDADQIVKLKCDVHPWMTAYVLVSSNPFFAVTGDDGTFKITGLPPGNYTVEAWHERYGAKTAQITVADKPAVAVFAFESK